MTQEPQVTTTLQRNEPYRMVVALDDNGQANGLFYADDGDSLYSDVLGEYSLFEFNAQNVSRQLP